MGLLSIPADAAFSSTRRFSLGSHDLIVAGDQTRYRVHRSVGVGYELFDETSHVAETFTYEQILYNLEFGGAKHSKDYYRASTQDATIYSAVENLAQLSLAERSTMLWKFEWAKRARAEIQKTGSRGVNESIVKEVQRQLVELSEAAVHADEPSRKRNAGTILEVPAIREPPTLRSLRRWLKMLDESGGDVRKFRDRRHVSSGNFEPRFAPEIQELIFDNVEDVLVREQPTLVSVYEILEAEAEEIRSSKEFKSEAEERLYQTPSIKTLAKAVHAVPEFKRLVTQHGLPAARLAMTPVGAGLDTSLMAPFERVEFDFWQVQLHTLLKKSRWKDVLTADEFKKLGAVRVTVGVGLDVATQCYVALAYGFSENTQLALDALKMAQVDKTHIAIAAGAKTPWPMQGQIVMTANDGGAAYKAEDYRSAVLACRIDPARTPAKNPRLRARVENRLRTLSIKVLPRFVGRTFSSPAEKADYDSVARAGLFVDELMVAFTRWVVDDYHNRPQRNLNGNTPLQAWMLNDYKVGIGPGPDEIRLIFGTKQKRTLTEKGIVFYNIWYNSVALQEYYRRHGNCEVDAVFDLDDLGHASVRVGTRIIKASAHHRYAGLDFDSWKAECDRILERMRVTDAQNFDVVAAAWLALRDIGEKGRRRLQFKPRLSDREIATQERLLMISFDMRDVAPSNADVVEVVDAVAASAYRPQVNSVSEAAPLPTETNEAPENAIIDQPAATAPIETRRPPRWTT